jgi:mycothiol synthase
MGRKPNEPVQKPVPSIPGLVFRSYEGREDIPVMVRSENACWKEDLIDAVITEEEMKQDFSHPMNMDPFKDVMIAEIKGRYAGHSITKWHAKPDGTRFYFVYAFVSHDWRGKGLRERLLRRTETRVKNLAKGHPRDIGKFLETYSNAKTNDWKSVLESEGYTPGWHLFEMVRPDLDGLPDFPLPPGVEVRPVKPGHYKVIWEAMKEAFKDERSFSEDKYGDNAFEMMMLSPSFKPELWRIAWSGNEVVGGVHNFINEEENKEFERKWGHTERIFVSRGWRKKGIARALIAQSLRVLKEQRMEEATLDVDTENPSGALRLYESLGFRQKLHFIFYWKQFC